MPAFALVFDPEVADASVAPALARERRGTRAFLGYDEGVTEFFTRKLGPEVQVERDDSSFLRQYTSVTHLVTAVSEPVVAAAYFGGDIAALKSAVDGKGKGTWDRWLDLLDGNDFKGANALMRASP